MGAIVPQQAYQIQELAIVLAEDIRKLKDRIQALEERVSWTEYKLDTN